MWSHLHCCMQKNPMMQLSFPFNSLWSLLSLFSWQYAAFQSNSKSQTWIAVITIATDGTKKLCMSKYSISKSCSVNADEKICYNNINQKKKTNEWWLTNDNKISLRSITCDVFLYSSFQYLNTLIHFTCTSLVLAWLLYYLLIISINN